MDRDKKEQDGFRPYALFFGVPGSFDTARPGQPVRCSFRATSFAMLLN
jgi:hypothetical protein